MMVKRKNRISSAIIKAINNGNKVLICGNGGSATMASHFTGELVGKLNRQRRALPAISLTSDTAIITAIANDMGYKYVFSRQLEALGNKGDVLLVLSTSGKSENCLEAISVARDMGIKVYEIPKSGYGTQDIQERQLKLLHKVADEVEGYYL